MPTTWISQQEFSSATVRTLTRTAPLADHFPVEALHQAMREYFRVCPASQQVTLACFRAFGRQHFESAATSLFPNQAPHSAFDRLKRDFGLWVPIQLMALVPAGDVMTLRYASSGRNCARKTPLVWGELAEWVHQFTPHRLVQIPASFLDA